MSPNSSHPLILIWDSVTPIIPISSPIIFRLLVLLSIRKGLSKIQSQVIKGTVVHKIQSSLIKGTVVRKIQSQVIKGTVVRKIQSSVIKGTVVRKIQSSVIKGLLFCVWPFILFMFNVLPLGVLYPAHSQLAVDFDFKEALSRDYPPLFFQ